MKDLNDRAFASLFREAHQKCFSYELTTPLTESESNHLSSEIFEKTGLVLGWKSLKNYSHYILGMPQAKSENPSTYTLDTLARYVVDAPATDEPQRKRRESHYPYWFRYKEAFYRSNQQEIEKPRRATPAKRPVVKFAVFMGLALIVILFIVISFRDRAKVAKFTEDFDSVGEDSLVSRGWFVKSMDAEYWERRDEKSSHLILFTLEGDNWPDSSRALNIKNLLLREIPFDCFIAELHLTEFFPKQNWQQAGILLLEDTSFAGKSLRMSIGYNDFSGGFAATKEVIIQAITSLGSDFINPEEIAHHQIFVLEQATENLIHENLENSALRIEKRGNKIRLLYSCGQMKNFAFKEVVKTEFDIQPKYIAIFALKGFVSNSDVIPVYIDFFSLTGYPCDD